MIPGNTSENMQQQQQQQQQSLPPNPPPQSHTEEYGQQYAGTGAGRGVGITTTNNSAVGGGGPNRGSIAGGPVNYPNPSSGVGYPGGDLQQQQGTSRRYTLSAAPGGNASPTGGQSLQQQQQQQVPIHGMGGAGDVMGAHSQRSHHSQQGFRGDMASSSPNNPHAMHQPQGSYPEHQLSPTHLAHRMSLGFYPMSGGGSTASPNFGALGDPLDLSGRSGLAPPQVGGGGGPGGPSGSGPGGAGGGPVTQAEREEELLLNLLIARRQRGRMSGDGKGGKNPQSLADELMRLRQSRAASQQQQQHQQQQQQQQQQRQGLPQLPGMPPLYSDSMSSMPPGSSVASNMMYTDPYHRATSMKADYPAHHQMRPMQDMAERISPGRFQMPDARMDLSERTANNAVAGFKRSMGSMGMGGANMGMMMNPMGYDGSGGGGIPSMGGYPTGLTGLEMQGMELPPAKKKRTHKKKPADMPRRPLSAYNLFFSEERERILKEIEKKEGKPADADGKEGSVKKEDEDKEDEEKPKALMRPLIPSQKKRRPHRKTHGKISFQQLARMVGERWKSLPDEERKYYQDLAQEDMKRQKVAMEEYYAKQNAARSGMDPMKHGVPGDALKLEPGAV